MTLSRLKANLTDPELKNARSRPDSPERCHRQTAHLQDSQDSTSGHPLPNGLFRQVGVAVETRSAD